MGLSDLESSRDGSAAYNCHRRANERGAWVSAREKPFFFYPRPRFVRRPRWPVQRGRCVRPLVLPFVGPLAGRLGPRSSVRSFLGPVRGRSLLLLASLLPPPVAAAWPARSPPGVKAVNWECACNYAT